VVPSWFKFHVLDVRGSLDRSISISGVSKGKLDLMSPSGRGVALVSIRVRYSHAGPVGTTEDLSSQTTKSRYHVMSQVIRITCEIM
jgi:hypothetical protein